MLDCEPQLVRWRYALPSASYGTEEKNGQKSNYRQQSCYMKPFPLLSSTTYTHSHAFLSLLPCNSLCS